MILQIPDLLTSAEIQRLRDIAAAAHFVDGKISNPHNKAKNNLQVDTSAQEAKEASQLLASALFRHEDFRNFSLPTRLAPPLLARYEPSMHYGPHSDSAFIPLPPQPPLRSDLSCTMWLSDPESYDGGELILHLESTPVKIKLPAGAAVVYPSTTIHEVANVTRGQRLVAITFIESQISDERQRHLLYTLGEISALEGFNISHENRTRLEYVRQNLTRMWASR